MKTKLIFLSLTVTQMLFFQVSAKVTSGSRPTINSESSPSVPTSNGGLAGTTTIPTYDNGVGTTVSCNAKDNSKNSVSWKFLTSIMYNPDALKVVQKNAHKGVINIPKHISACLKLEFDISTVGNYTFIKPRNTYNFSASDVAPAKLADLSIDQKYDKCMVNKGLVNGQNNQLEWGKAEKTSQVSWKTAEFNMKLASKNKNQYVIFASNKTSEYASYPKAEVKSAPSGWNCTRYENMHKTDGNGPYRLFTSEEDKAAQQAVAACQTEDYNEIYSQLRNLDNSVLGNASELRDYLEKALVPIKEQQANKIYKKLKEIEKSFRPDAEGNLPDEDAAEKLANEYVAQIKELHKIVVKPSINKITELIDGRNNDNRKETDKKIKSLNKTIGQYYRDHRGNLAFIIDGFKKYNLQDQMRDVEGMMQVSNAYSKVYKSSYDANRGTRLSLKKAQSQVKSRLDKFEREVLTDWSRDYQSLHGSKAPILTTKREINKRKKRMNKAEKKYRKSKVERKIQHFCQRQQTRNGVRVRSASKCKRYRMQKKRFLSKRGKNLRYLNSRATRLNNYSENYSNFVETRRESQFGDNEDSLDFYGVYYDSMVYGEDSDNDIMFDMGVNQGWNNYRQPGSFNQWQQPGQFPQGPGPGNFPTMR